MFSGLTDGFAEGFVVGLLVGPEGEELTETPFTFISDCPFSDFISTLSGLSDEYVVIFPFSSILIFVLVAVVELDESETLVSTLRFTLLSALAPLTPIKNKANTNNNLNIGKIIPHLASF